MNVLNFILTLSMIIISILIVYGFYNAIIDIKEDIKSNKNESNVPMKKLDFSTFHWRGGVSYPMGLHKSASDFYKIENNLKFK